MLAWKLGCKGITVYVTGSRDKVVLETHATAGQKQSSDLAETSAALATAAPQQTLWHEVKKPRPRYLPGFTYTIETPLGKAFITINENGGNQPFEMFVNTAKAGSDTAAVSEAIGRLISYILRLASPIEPIQRLEEVTRQLVGIGGGRSLGFGPNRVRSLPDGLAQVLMEYLQQHQEREANELQFREDYPNGNGSHTEVGQVLVPVEQPLLQIGDLCPECGQAAVINEEGCRKCYACGYSEC
jgi:ribonucleoside-diphosphate reductase alpha chain